MDRGDARLRAGLVRLAARRTGHPDRAEHLAAALDDHAAAQDHNMRQVPHAALRLARLGKIDQHAGVAAKTHRSPRLAACGARRMRSGVSIAQDHLHHATAVDHRDRHLPAAVAAFLQRRLRRLERGLGREVARGICGCVLSLRQTAENQQRRAQGQTCSCSHVALLKFCSPAAIAPATRLQSDTLPTSPRCLFQTRHQSTACIRSTMVLSILTRVKYLSSASTTVHGAISVLVRSIRSHTDCSYSPHFLRLRQSSSVILKRLKLVFWRKVKRLSCSSAVICSQNLHTIAPPRVICSSKSLISLYARIQSATPQKPSTRSTSTR